MTVINPFCAIRPREDLSSSIAALPYDVYNTEEARLMLQKSPLSFLKIDRPEIQFPVGTDPYSAIVYEKAKDTLSSMLADGSFTKDSTPCYYIYELTMNGHTQTGLVGCASIDDYNNGVIARHENTIAGKEQDRIRHITALNAQTGPIFLAYRSNQTIAHIMETVQQEKPLCHFTSEDGVLHSIWKIVDAKQISSLQTAFSSISKVYIADGHHRAASAVKVGLKCRAETPDYSGNESFNYFLSVLFPDEQLQIFDYNRVALDLNGYTVNTFIKALGASFHISPSTSGPVRPTSKGTFGMYLDKNWYSLSLKEQLFTDDPVAHLDVSILQECILTPLLAIDNPRTSSRIRFVGGIRGLSELEREVDARSDGVAFSMYPTSMKELFEVADAGQLMPPKSTWFEPKLRSGLFIHEI